MSGKLDLIRRRFRETKDDHSGAMLLLHIGSAYYALYDDALRAARASNGSVERLHGASSLLYCRLAEGSLDQVLKTLKSAGCDVVVLESPGPARSMGEEVPFTPMDSIFKSNGSTAENCR